MEKQSAIEILESHGIRPSVQRIEVVQYLMGNRTHPTVDDIYTALSGRMPMLSRTTVYNVLRVLVENGVVLELLVDGQSSRYDIDVSAHAHFRCTKCGRIFDVVMPVISNEIGGGFQVERTDVYYYGVCPDCAKK